MFWSLDMKKIPVNQLIKNLALPSDNYCKFVFNSDHCMVSEKILMFLTKLQKGNVLRPLVAMF